MYLITNRSFCSRDRYIAVVVEAVMCGVENIIIREKDLSDRELESIYRDIVGSLDYKNANFIINSNLNLFEKLNFDGLHLSFELFLTLLESGYNFIEKFKENKILGLSLHSINEVEKLNKIVSETKIKIDYITLSHIYKTDCKKGLEPKGIKLLQDCKKITDIKIVALGGILPSNVREVIKYSDDFAVMSIIMKSSNIKKTIKEYGL